MIFTTFDGNSSNSQKVAYVLLWIVTLVCQGSFAKNAYRLVEEIKNLKKLR